MNTEIIREEFTAWMRRELPANTIIGDPEWWARKILNAIAILDAKAEPDTANAVHQIGWITEDYKTDRSATTYDKAVSERWVNKGWPVSEIFLITKEPS